MSATHTPTTPQDIDLIHKITDRFMAVNKQHPRPDRMDIALNLLKCHEDGCRLDLARLVKASDFELCHDVAGICNHIDPGTGKLSSGFSPRFHA